MIHAAAGAGSRRRRQDRGFIAATAASRDKERNNREAAQNNSPASPMPAKFCVRHVSLLGFLKPLCRNLRPRFGRESGQPIVAARQCAVLEFTLAQLLQFLIRCQTVHSTDSKRLFSILRREIAAKQTNA
jgi:hypothetical protein